MKVIFQVWLDVCAGEKFIWACLWYRFKHLNCMGMKYPNSTRHWHFHWSQNIECFSYRISMMMKMVKMNWRSWCCFLQTPSSRLLFCVNTLIGGVMGQFGWMDPPPDSWWLPWWWWWVGALDLNNLFNLKILAWLNFLWFWSPQAGTLGGLQPAFFPRTQKDLQKHDEALTCQISGWTSQRLNFF